MPIKHNSLDILHVRFTLQTLQKIIKKAGADSGVDILYIYNSIAAQYTNFFYI